MVFLEAHPRREAIKYPNPGPFWTTYQARSEEVLPNGMPREEGDWGMCFIFQFGCERLHLMARFLDLVSEFDLQLRNLSLEDHIELVPYYEIGADYLIQPKPPYDGGYSGGHWESFVEHGDQCFPPTEYIRERAAIIERFVENTHLIEAGSESRTELIRGILHRSLIRPSGNLFWGGGEGEPWWLYWPEVEIEELEAFEPRGRPG